MVFKESGSFRYNAEGFINVDDAKKRVLLMKEKLPSFLKDSIETEIVSISTNTGIISAHLSAYVLDEDF